MIAIKINLTGWNVVDSDINWKIIDPKPESEVELAQPKAFNMFGAGITFMQDNSIVWHWSATTQNQLWQFYNFWTSAVNKKVSLFAMRGPLGQTALYTKDRDYNYGYVNAIINPPQIKRIRQGLWELTVKFTNVHLYEVL